MKVKVIESFLLGGEHQEQGTVIDVSEQDHLRLKQMGRVGPVDGEEEDQKPDPLAAIDKMKKADLLELAIKLDVVITDNLTVPEIKEILKAKVSEV